MSNLPEYLGDYQRQLEKGYIQKAYKGLMEYITGLRTYLKKRYPGYIVPGNIYYGYMDMTYFSFFPESFKNRGLKVAIVFIHGTFSFEAWLAGYNRNVQTQYWKTIKNSHFTKYKLSPNPKTYDFILAHPLVSNPDFSALDKLTEQLEKGVVDFILNIDDFLAAHQGTMTAFPPNN